jgi:hypothetical protein
MERLEFFLLPTELQNKSLTSKNHVLKVSNHRTYDGALFIALSQKSLRR